MYSQEKEQLFQEACELHILSEPQQETQLVSNNHIRSLRKLIYNLDIGN